MARRQLAGRVAPTALPLLAQDAVLQRHFIHFLRGADVDFGPKAAAALDAVIRKAREEYGMSFGAYVARLIEQDAKAQGWL